MRFPNKQNLCVKKYFKKSPKSRCPSRATTAPITRVGRKQTIFQAALVCVSPAVSARRPSTLLRCLRLSFSLRLSPTRLSAGREYSCQLIDPAEIDSWAGGSRQRGRQTGESRFSGRQRGNGGIRSVLVAFIFCLHLCFSTRGSSVCNYIFGLACFPSFPSLFSCIFMLCSPPLVVVSSLLHWGKARKLVRTFSLSQLGSARLGFALFGCRFSRGR